jgi:zinc transport system permease protein
VALALVLLQRQRRLATDTLLGILAHTTLSLGLVTLAFLETVRVDLVSYLFGDILAINPDDLYWIWGGAALALAALAGCGDPAGDHRHEELAQVEGVPVFPVRLAFMLLIAIVIAVAMKVVGILLITSLLIIPAAAARRFARSPEGMAAVGQRTGLRGGRRLGTVGVAALGYPGRSLGRGGRRPSVSARAHSSPTGYVARSDGSGWAINSRNARQGG